jgi:hypothetical protein
MGQLPKIFKLSRERFQIDMIIQIQNLEILDIFQESFFQPLAF